MRKGSLLKQQAREDIIFANSVINKAMRNGRPIDPTIITHEYDSTRLERVMSEDFEAKELKAMCWCESKILSVPKELVRKCLTLSCGAKTCHA